MDPEATQNLTAALNRIADEISAHLSWMREQKKIEEANRTGNLLPPVTYEVVPPEKPPPPLDIQQRMLNGQWPLIHGDSYDHNHPPPGQKG